MHILMTPFKPLCDREREKTSRRHPIRPESLSKHLIRSLKKSLNIFLENTYSYAAS